MIPEKYISLKQLQLLVKQALDEKFVFPVWVSAEISDMKVNYSGHCYLELIEKGDRDAVPAAQARATIWRSQYARIASYFEAETGSRLEPGIRILAKVMVNYHEIYGFSLQITDIDPTFTLGDMERKRQQTIDQLKKEGVWDMNHDLVMPDAIQRIAIISSAQAAGYQDFCKELEKSPFRFELTLYDAFMQGQAAEESIIEALCEAAQSMEDYDVVVIIRGGGSRSDLNCFDSYRLCAHIAQFPLPILTGIGHDKDTSVADMVAHTPLKTPTAVAGWLVDQLYDAEARLDGAALQLRDCTQEALHRAEVLLERYRSSLKQGTLQLLTQRRVRLERNSGNLGQFTTALVTRHKARLEQLTGLIPDLAKNLLKHKRQRLDTATELIESRSPKQILRLGFAIVRTPRSGVISAEGVAVGDRVEIEVADGKIGAIVNEKQIWQKKK